MRERGMGGGHRRAGGAREQGRDAAGTVMGPVGCLLADAEPELSPRRFLMSRVRAKKASSTMVLSLADVS